MNIELILYCTACFLIGVVIGDFWARHKAYKKSKQEYLFEHIDFGVPHNAKSVTVKDNNKTGGGG
ncbi:MAG: hypothetical protein QM504_08180, partial [Pseudomonadota bacterium]